MANLNPISEAHLIDCMDFMRTLPDKFFDLAVVDPPYGYGSVVYMPKERIKSFGGYFDKYEISIATIDTNQRKMNKVEVVHSQLSKQTIRSFEEENVSPPPDYFDQLFRVSRHQIIWGGNYFMLPPSRGFVIWEKTTVVETFSMAMAEYAWLSFNTNSKIFKGAPQGNKNEPRTHPTQKPIALYKWLLTNYAKPGQKIFDSHMGSQSSRIAAYQLGFDYWGCELDPDYYRDGCKRFDAVIHKRDTSEYQPIQVTEGQTRMF